MPAFRRDVRLSAKSYLCHRSSALRLTVSGDRDHGSRLVSPDSLDLSLGRINSASKVVPENTLASSEMLEFNTAEKTNDDTNTQALSTLSSSGKRRKIDSNRRKKEAEKRCLLLVCPLLCFFLPSFFFLSSFCCCLSFFFYLNKT